MITKDSINVVKMGPGFQYFDSYFDKCTKIIKYEDMMLLQAITVADQCYETA